MLYPRLIVIGCNGYIGRHFCKAFPKALAIDRSQLDLENPFITFPTVGYTFALIAAGISAPIRCEKDPIRTFACNVEGTLKLGEMLLEKGVRPIFLSSDYVLDDSLIVAPLNTYGRQKAELERRGTEMGGLVLRLSKVYGVEKGDGTLFDAMAAKLTRGEPIAAAYDQIFSPIFMGDVMQRVVTLMTEDRYGVEQLVGPRFASRFEMARVLAKKLNVDEELVHEISLSSLKDGVERPKFLKLTSSFPAMDWQEGIERVATVYA